MNELKPCPICASPARTGEWLKDDETRCSNADCFMSYHFVRRHRWNARASQWIPCSERRPEKEGGYLTTLRSEHGFEVAELYLWFDDDGLTHWAAGGDGYPDDFQGVIAWMPLPDPYQPDDKEQRINAVAKSFQSFVEKNAEGLVNAVEVKK